MNFTLSKHAEDKMKNRRIQLDIIEQVLSDPQQILPDIYDTLIHQSIVDFGEQKPYLVRIIVAQRGPVHVITVYKTSQIKKYWRNDYENQL